MAEYIERENYCENVCHRANEYCDKESCPIWKAPVADVAPVVHGHWIEDGDYQICSECGEEHCWDEYRAAYCDSCGAKMDGKDGASLERPDGVL